MLSVESDSVKSVKKEVESGVAVADVDVVNEVDEVDESEDIEGLDAPVSEDLLHEAEEFNDFGYQRINIDRDEEDADVEKFQKTGDLKLLEKVYKNRIPTIKTWANRNFNPNIIASVDDLFEELSLVFVKAAEKYNRKRGRFNTVLWTFFINRIKNLKSSKYAKKRISEEYKGPISSMLLSLDYSYNDKDGSEITLKDIIPSKETNEKGYVLGGTYLDETLNMLSSNNPQFKDFLVKISEGGSLASLLKEYKTKTGQLKINNVQAKQLSKRKSKKVVSDIIRSAAEVNGDFKLLEYDLDSSRKLTYAIEMKRTKETDSFIKTIRDLKRNKNNFIGRIKGLK